MGKRIGSLANGTAIIGHRGASGEAPENTMTAFRLAAQMGADAVEFDVQLTRDMEPVVIHDQYVDRTTNGKGKVSHLSLEEIKRLDAGIYFDSQYQGEQVPHLQEVLELQDDDLRMNVELKSGKFDRSLVEKTYEWIFRCSRSENVLVSSFNPYLLLHAHRIYPDIPLGLLVTVSMGRIVRYILKKLIPHQAYHPESRLVTQETLIVMQSQGIAVNAWTINDQQTMSLFSSWGIDGIITNYPDKAIQRMRNH